MKINIISTTHNGFIEIILKRKKQRREEVWIEAILSGETDWARNLFGKLFPAKSHRQLLILFICGRFECLEIKKKLFVQFIVKY